MTTPVQVRALTDPDAAFGRGYFLGTSSIEQAPNLPVLRLDHGGLLIGDAVPASYLGKVVLSTASAAQARW